MESTNSETTFMKLPTTLQLEILKSLSWADQKSVRLVSIHMYALSNYLGTPVRLFVSDWNQNAVLNVLKSSSLASIKHLFFCGFLYQPLPILSSTRIMIPKTKTLTIRERVSKENVLKLIRYYAKWSEKLHFIHPSLPLLKSVKYWGSSESLKNINKFFVTGNYGLHYNQHHLALGQFLEWAHLPNLQELNFTIYHLVNANSVIQNKIHGSFVQFLNKHGQKLVSLELELPRTLWFQIMTCFQYFTNVQDLIIRDYLAEGLGSIHIDTIKTAFSHFIKLKSINVFLNTRIHDEIIGLLLSLNKNTIVALTSNNVHTSLSWLHKSPPSSSLRYLDLSINDINQNPEMFNEATSLNFKLENVKKLTIKLSNFTRAPDFGPHFHAWKRQVMPNLKAIMYYI